MKAQIDLLTIWTDDTPRMAAFYRDALGFAIKLDMGGYVEFEHEGVRFAVCARSVMVGMGFEGFGQGAQGQTVELAFRCATPDEVDREYAALIAKGAAAVQEPGDMPWGQRTAFFADPDGNVHELFADLPPAGDADAG
ncbi:MAG: VOC family protein [Anaerolineae bacterium]